MPTYKLNIRNTTDAEMLVAALYESGNIALFEYADLLKLNIQKAILREHRKDRDYQAIANREAELRKGWEYEIEKAREKLATERVVSPELQAAVQPRTPVEPPPVV
jgi:hypothetical protein